MSDEKFPAFPEEAHGDGAYKVARTTLGALDLAVPLVGQGVQHLLDRFVGAPLDKRREEWFRLLGVKFQELLDRPEGFDPETLAGNEEFVSTVADATQAAMRTHHQKKREALANAVANTAAGYSLDEVVRGSFIGYIERYSPLHLRILQMLADPRRSEAMASAASGLFAASQKGVLRTALQDDSISNDAYDRVLRDLDQDGLVDGSLSGTMTGQSLLNKRTTPSGDKFLRFISQPLA